MNLKFVRQDKYFRSTLMIYVFAIGFAFIGVRAYYVQVVDHKYYVNQFNLRAVRDVSSGYLRRGILDSNGVPIAASIWVNEVCIDPVEYSPSWYEKDALGRLGLSIFNEAKPVLGSPTISATCTSNGTTRDVLEQLDQLDVHGIYIKSYQKRIYSAKEETFALLGGVRRDGVGARGLELALDDVLRGNIRKRRVVVDRLGRVIERDPTQMVRSLDPYSISIDVRRQIFLHKLLQYKLEGLGAAQAGAIIIDALSGRILALADAASFEDEKLERVVPLVLSKELEPGFLISPFIAMIGLSSGVASLEDVVSGDVIFNQIAREMGSGNERVKPARLAEHLSSRSALGVASVGVKIKPTELARSMASLGFGRKSDLEFPGERTGNFPSADTWKTEDHLNVATGKKVTVTLAQLVSAYSILLNSGRRAMLTFSGEKDSVRLNEFVSASFAEKVLLAIEGGERVGRRSLRGKSPVTVLLMRKWEEVNRRFGSNPKKTNVVAVVILKRPIPLVAGFYFELDSNMFSKFHNRTEAMADYLVWLDFELSINRR